MDTLEFKGLRQVTFEEFDSINSSDRVGYLWFVRHFSGETPTHLEIYLSNRKYGEINDENELELIKEQINTLNNDILDIDNILSTLTSSVSGLTNNVNEISDDVEYLEEKINELEYTSCLERVTYDDLCNLRDNHMLIPGKKYRIIDYETTTSIPNTRAMGHNFDIIVTAISEHEINENALACKHEDSITGVTDYFEYCNLNNWKLKYSLDNDNTKYSWVSDDDKIIDNNNTIYNRDDINDLNNIDLNEWQYLPNNRLYAYNDGNNIRFTLNKNIEINNILYEAELQTSYGQGYCYVPFKDIDGNVLHDFNDNIITFKLNSENYGTKGSVYLPILDEYGVFNNEYETTAYTSNIVLTNDSTNKIITFNYYYAKITLDEETSLPYVHVFDYDYDTYYGGIIPMTDNTNGIVWHQMEFPNSSTLAYLKVIITDFENNLADIYVPRVNHTNGGSFTKDVYNGLYWLPQPSITGVSFTVNNNVVTIDNYRCALTGGTGYDRVFGTPSIVINEYYTPQTFTIVNVPYSIETLSYSSEYPIIYKITEISTITSILNKGKGVIYYMEDEYNNIAPYDFKNIQFKRYTVNPTELYNNSGETYESAIINYCENELIEPNETFHRYTGLLYNEDNQELELPNNDLVEVNKNNSEWFYTFSGHRYNIEMNQYDNERIDITVLNNINEFEGYSRSNSCCNNKILKYQKLGAPQELNNIVLESICFITNLSGETVTTSINPPYNNIFNNVSNFTQVYNLNTYNSFKNNNFNGAFSNILCVDAYDNNISGNGINSFKKANLLAINFYCNNLQNSSIYGFESDSEENTQSIVLNFNNNTICDSVCYFKENNESISNNFIKINGESLDINKTNLSKIIDSNEITHTNEIYNCEITNSSYIEVDSISNSTLDSVLGLELNKIDNSKLIGLEDIYYGDINVINSDIKSNSGFSLQNTSGVTDLQLDFHFDAKMGNVILPVQLDSLPLDNKLYFDIKYVNNDLTFYAWCFDGGIFRSYQSLWDENVWTPIVP